MSEWTLLSNHGHVLLAIADDPGIRLRDVALRVGITERSAQGILRDLSDAGYVRVSKHGRRNHYDINSEQPLRHPTQRHHRVGELIAVLGDPVKTESGGPAAG